MSAQAFVETMKKLIAREVAPLLPSWRWGHVTALGPVVIELDAEQGTLSEIGSLVSGLAIGDRVQVLTWGTRSTITGIAGGGDTGWVPLIILPGFAAAVDEDPEVRRIGGVVYVRGIFSNTGLTANGTFTVAELPPGFAPPINYPLRAGTQSGAINGTIFFFATGDVQIRTGPTLGSYYSTAAANWPIS